MAPSSLSYLGTSSHYTNWIFTHEELSRIEEVKHGKAKHAIASGKNRSARAFACFVPSSCTIDKATQSSPSETLEVPKDDVEEGTYDWITIEEERTILKFYESKVQEACTDLFRCSDKVKSCAIMLFKRFYLSNSVMEFHPKYLVPTVIYVAGKVEEQFISVNTVASQLAVDFTQIISHELVLLAGTRFQVLMYHPFRPLMGFLDDLRSFCQKAAKTKDLSVEVLQRLHADSVSVISKMLLTSVPLRFNPSILALAALRMTVEKQEDDKTLLSVLDKYIRTSHKKQLNKKAADKLLRSLSELQDEITSENKENTIDPSVVKKLYKKLKPFYKDSSSEQQPKKKKRKKDKK